MQIDFKDLKAASEAKLITTTQAQNVWRFWQQQNEQVPQFRFSHVLYYFGGLLAISAVTLFVTQAWDQLRGWPLFLIATALFVLGLVLSHYFLRRKLTLPAGIMTTFSLVLVPLAVYNIQVGLGLLPPQPYHYSDFHFWVNWYWVPMELITLLAGVILFYCYGFAFLLFPIAITLWYLSMDLFDLLFTMQNFSHRSTFSMYFGLLVILAAIYMDFKYRKNQQDYAFWLYIFGALTFWGGLSLQSSSSELSRFIYCLINVGMIVVSVILNRRVFAILGAVGVFGYLSHLAFNLFAHSLLFPLALVLLGIAIIFAATYWPQAENKIKTLLPSYLSHRFLNKRKNRSLD